MNRDQVMICVFIAMAAGIFVYFQTVQEEKRLETAIRPVRDSIIVAQRPRLITFSAKWCGAWLQFKPVLTKTMGNYIASIDYEIVDIDKKANSKMAHDFGVTEIPATFIFDRQGKLIHKQVGFIESEELDTYLRKTVF